MIIDISHWRPVTDWDALAPNLDMLICKVSQGTGFQDDSWPTDKAQALQRRIPLVGFHFASNDDAAGQHANFKATGGDDSKGTWGRAFDLETNPNGTTVTGPVLEQLVQLAYSEWGIYPLLYSRADFLNQLVFQSGSIVYNCPLLLADWDTGLSAPPVPNGWATWIAWQYNDGVTGDGPYMIAGISQAVDHDKLNPAYTVQQVMAMITPLTQIQKMLAILQSEPQDAMIKVQWPDGKQVDVLNNDLFDEFIVATPVPTVPPAPPAPGPIQPPDPTPTPTPTPAPGSQPGRRVWTTDNDNLRDAGKHTGSNVLAQIPLGKDLYIQADKPVFDVPSKLTYVPLAPGGAANATAPIDPSKQPIFVAANLISSFDPASPPVLTPGTHKLQVTYNSQNIAGARKYRNDCGAACVWMLLHTLANKLGLAEPTFSIDDLADQTSLAKADVGLDTWELAKLAAQHGLTLALHTGDVTVPFVAQQIMAGFPVVCLIRYADLPEREDPDPFGHFVVVTGVEVDAGGSMTHVYLHDPDWWKAGKYQVEQGAYLKVTAAEFSAALANAPANPGSKLNQGLVVFWPAFTQSKQSDYPEFTCQDEGGTNLRWYGSINAPLVNAGFKKDDPAHLDLSRQNANKYIPVIGETGEVIGWALGTEFSTTPATLPMQPTPPPVSNPGIPGLVPTSSKMSLHVMAGSHGGQVVNLVGACRAAGRRMPGIHLTRSLNWQGQVQIASLKQVDPDLLFSLRILYPDSYLSPKDDKDWRWLDFTRTDMRWQGKALGDWYQDSFIEPDKDAQLASWHQPINEPTSEGSTPYLPVGGLQPSHFQGFVTLWHGILDSFEARGRKCAVFAFPMENPPLEFWQDTGVLDLLRRVKAGGHILMLHQYLAPDLAPGNWTEQISIMRHKQIIALLPDDLKNILMCCGEFGAGYAAQWGIQQLLAGWAQADKVLAGDNMLFMGNWTVDTGGNIKLWGPSDLSGHLSEIQAYLVGYQP